MAANKRNISPRPATGANPAAPIDESDLPDRVREETICKPTRRRVVDTRTVRGMEELRGEATPKRRTKAQQAAADAWFDPDSATKLRVNLLQAHKDAIRGGQEDAQVFSLDEMGKLIVGIPTPSIAFEWLTGNDVYPLGIVEQLAGGRGSCKSLLAYDRASWFNDAGGYYDLKECESKVSPTLLRSVIGYDRPDSGMVQICESLDEWQTGLTTSVTSWKKLLQGTADAPGPGKTIPILLMVDSLNGKAVKARMDKIRTVGHAERDYPAEALLTSPFLKSLASQIARWPFSVILTNHAMLDMSDPNKVRLPGGAMAQYQETYEFLTSIWAKKFNNASFNGVGIRLTCNKNSLGPTHRAIKTRVIWWYETVESPSGEKVSRQQTMVDWDWATVTFLAGTDNPEVKKGLKSVDFHMAVKSETAEVGCLAQCRDLGMSKTEWLPFAEVGRMIADNPEIMSRLRLGLNIERRNVLSGDYARQLQQLEKSQAAKAAEANKKAAKAAKKGS